MTDAIGRKTEGFGWIPDLPDVRDLAYSAPVPTTAQVMHYDLRPGFPEPPYSQGQASSCTGNGTAGAIQYVYAKEGLVELMPSRLFIYYNSRLIEGQPGVDGGAMIRDSIKGVATYGWCAEALWPYDLGQLTIKPRDDCYASALPHEGIQYMRLSPLPAQLLGCLAEGYPFVFGFAVFESFESRAVQQSGIVPMPQPGEKLIGGHCVVGAGIDLDGVIAPQPGMLLCRNSYGEEWGQDGYFWIPLSYVCGGLADDFWTIRVAP